VSAARLLTREGRRHDRLRHLEHEVELERREVDRFECAGVPVVAFEYCDQLGHACDDGVLQ